MHRMPPKFFDLQVNGYAGVDFNAIGLDSEQIGNACTLLAEHGVTGVLATIITDHLDAMCRKLDRLAQLHKDPVIGIHIEGPFISARPGFVGAHPAEHVQPATVDAMKRLLDAAQGLTRMVTLAPEQDPGGLVTRYLHDQGILVSAGHCDASIEQLRTAETRVP